MSGEKVRLCGLWKNESKDGGTYYSGSLSPGVKLLVFKNGFKKENRDPDLIAYLVPAEKRSPGSGSNGPESSTEPGRENVPF